MAVFQSAIIFFQDSVKARKTISTRLSKTKKLIKSSHSVMAVFLKTVTLKIVESSH